MDPVQFDALSRKVADGVSLRQAVARFGAAGLLATMAAMTQTGASTNIGMSANVVLTATGAVATFRWLILVDDTPTSPLNPVVGWLDHGSDVTMANTDTYTIPSGNLLVIG